MDVQCTVRFALCECETFFFFCYYRTEWMDGNDDDFTI